MTGLKNTVATFGDKVEYLLEYLHISLGMQSSIISLKNVSVFSCLFYLRMEWRVAYEDNYIYQHSYKILQLRIYLTEVERTVATESKEEHES